MVREGKLVLWGAGILLVVALFLAGGFAIRTSVAATHRRSEQVRATRALLFKAIKSQLDEETGVRGYAATGQPDFLQPYYAARSTLPDTLANLRTSLGNLQLPAAVVAVADASRTNAAWVKVLADPIIARKRNAAAAQNRGKALVDRYRADTNDAESALAERDKQLSEDFGASLSRLAELVVGAGIILLVAGFLFTWLQERSWRKLERARERSDADRQRSVRLRAAYEAEKRIADALQEAISQRELPSLPSMRFSATYAPATEEMKVGGDWYDAFELGSERILFAVGDIAGHGIEAAVGMSRVRNSVLSAALLEHDAASILARVNREIALGEKGPLVTAVVGTADPRTYEFEYSTAGHPPPILLEPGREPRLLEFGSLPLGVGPKSEYRNHRIQSVPGAMLVLYTDGAIEYSRDVLAGEVALLAAVAGVAKTPNLEPASAIFRTIFDGREVGDDVAILTLGFSTSRTAGLTISGEDARSSFTGEVGRRSTESATPLGFLPRTRSRLQSAFQRERPVPRESNAS